jgi:hypothetical protein
MIKVPEFFLVMTFVMPLNFRYITALCFQFTIHHFNETFIRRTLLNKINHKPEFDEELIRKYLVLIDLEEFKIREKLIKE